MPNSSPQKSSSQKPQVYSIKGRTVTVAATAGFCFGVERAVSLTQQLLAQGKQVATIGPLIHNPQVVKQLAAGGAVVVQSPAQLPPGATAVVRSHGVPASVMQALAKTGAPICNATCPFVAKIHDIAQECGKKGHTLLVAGDALHPEVMGIVGHALGPVHVFSGLPQLKALAAQLGAGNAVTVVAQTTFQLTNWLECTAFIKKVCTNWLVFGTICNATWARQREAEELARNCDLIIVVGGQGSSNTKKLFGVAKAHTKAVQIESASELCALTLEGVKTIGITAGASTPSSAIEEVVNTMNDVMDNVVQEKELSFEEMLNDSMKPVYAGQIVKGVVEAVSANEITVDIGTKHTGIVRLDELTDDPAVRNAADVVKRDDELELAVIKVSDQEGIVYLSRRQMQARKGAEEVARAAEDGTVMDGYVVESNKGGLVALVKGVKVFIPASQATARRGDDYMALVRTHVKLKIKEFSPRRTIGSIREVMAEGQRAFREAFWASVEEGKQYTGTVKSLTNYGAFVDIGGVDGLVHISELSWSRIKHPSEVLRVGESIEVYVKEVDRESHKVSLGYKKQEEDPWQKLREGYPVGSVFNAPIISLTQFGAFVRILPGVDGLVHISEISYDRVEKVADALSVGQEVAVKLLDVDYDRHRISLSIKALLPAPEAAADKDGEDTLVASASSEETSIAATLVQEMEDEAKEKE